MTSERIINPSEDFIQKIQGCYGTILADPPWRFSNRTGKIAPEHRRLSRYATLSFKEIRGIPVSSVAAQRSHLYLWVPNALLTEGLEVMRAWGFIYKTNIVWHKIRKDGGPDGRGVGFYFRNTTELVLFGIKGQLRTLSPGRSQVNVIRVPKREHSRKPDELYSIIEACSPGPYLELFARGSRPGWSQWGNEVDDYRLDWPTYKNNSKSAQDYGLTSVDSQPADKTAANDLTLELGPDFELRRGRTRRLRSSAGSKG
jgi:N6-adenosine-specific RNA methylase IME4